MSFSAWAHSHARSILFLFGALALAGAVASVSLPVALFPQVTFPRVRITLEAGDRPAEQMTVEVTTPVEEAVRAIPGVRNLRSTTSRGTSEISVNFNWGEDMISAMLQCQSQVNKILPSLPSGTSFEVERMDPTVFPVIAYSLTSDSHSLVELPICNSGRTQLKIDNQSRHFGDLGQLQLGRRHDLGNAAMPVAGKQNSPEPAVRHFVRSRAHGSNRVSGDCLQSHLRFAFAGRA